MKPNFANTPATDEWMTPSYILDPIRDFLGAIDIDPASSSEANSRVQARRYFTKNDNGLIFEWRGRVFLNPPYSSPLLLQFITKLDLEIAIGNVDEAIVLVNNKTETQWFRQLGRICQYVCFPDKRIQFLLGGGKPGPNSNNNGQAIFYFGDRGNAFIKGLQDVGTVYARMALL